MALGNLIDERIVQMRFENRDFESRANQSISTLERLDQSINKLSENGNGIDFSRLADAVDSIADRFTTMGVVGMNVISNITNSVMNMGKQMIKSVTVDQMSVGFGKYESIMQSVQTIMNSTGLDLNTTMAALEKLNWFTDETSYNLMDMVSNIARFTNAGVDLNTAITSMIGIADAAGYAGVGINEASHAMIGFSNAISRGVMQSNSWQWIETAHLDSTKLKEIFIETAVAEGTLKEVSEGVWQTLKGTTVTVADFKNTLHDGWLVTNVINKALKRFGGTTEDIYKIYQETGETASEIIDTMDIAEDDLGLQAFKASQIAKTWSDAINSVRDAVSTGFMTSIQYVIGDFEEATKLWTAVSEELYDLFAEPGNRRNDILQLWHDAGGRDILLEGLSTLWEDVKAVFDFVKDIWQAIFGTFGYTTEEAEQAAAELGINISDYVEEPLSDIALAALKLLTWTKKFRNFVQSLVPSEKTITNFARILLGAFSIIDMGRMAVSALWEILKAFFPVLGDLGGSFLEIVANIADFFTNLRNSAIESGTFTDKIQELVTWIRNATQSVKDFFGSFSLSGFGERIGKIFDTIRSFFSEKFSSPFGGSFSEFLTNFFSITGGAVGVGIGVGIFKIIRIIKTAVESVGGLIDSIAGSIAQFKSTAVASTLLQISIAIALLAGSLALVAAINPDRLEASFLALTGLIGELVGVGVAFSAVQRMFSGFKSFTDIFNRTGKMATSLIKFAGAILILAISMKVISDIPEDALLRSLASISLLVAEMLLVSVAISKIGSIKKSGLGSLIFLATAVAILASVAKSISGMEWAELAKAGAGITGIMSLLIIFMALTNKLSNKKKGLGGLILVSAAVAILAAVARSFSQMKWEELAKAGAGAAGIMSLFIIFMALTNKLSNKGKGLGGLILVSAAVAILAAVARSFSQMKWEELAKAGAGAAGIISLFIIFMALTNKLSNKKKGLGGLILVSAAVAILAAVARSFSQMNWIELAKAGAGAAGIMSLFIIFMALSNKLSNKGKGLGGLILVSAAVAILAAVARSFAKLEWEELAKAGVALVGIMGSLIAFMALTSKLSNKGKGLASLLVVSIAVLAIGDSLSKVAKYNWKQILAAGVSMGLCLVAVGTSMWLLGKSGGKLDPITFATFAAALVGIVAIGYTLGQLAQYPWQNMIGIAAAMGVALLSVAATLFLIGLTSKNLNVVSLVGLVVGVGALIGVGYALSQLSGLGDWKSIGASALVCVGTMLAVSLVVALIGAIGPGPIALGMACLAIIVGIGALIIWGIAALGGPIMDTAATFAEKLNTFIEKLQPFMDAVVNITEDQVAGADRFMGLMGYVAGATFWTTVAGIISSINNGVNFASNISTMIQNLQPFLDSVTNISDDAVLGVGKFNTIMNVMVGTAFWTTLAGIISSINNGVTFSSNISTMFSNLQPFLSGVAAIPDDAVTGTGKLKTIMAALVTETIWSTIASVIDTLTDSPTFATKMSDFMTNFGGFLTGVKSVDESAVTGVTNLKAVMSSLVSTTIWSKVSSWVSSWGKSSLTELGTNLSAFVTNALPFFTSLGAIDAGVFTNVDTFLATLSTVDDGSIFSNFGKELKNFHNKVKDIDFGICAQALGLVSTMIAMSTSSGDGTFIAFDGITTWLASIVTALGSLPNDTLTAFTTAGANAAVGFANGLIGNAQTVVNAATNLANLALTTFKSILGIHSPSRVFEEFGYYSDMGLAKGLLGGTGLVTDATDNVADSVVSPMEEMLNYLSGVLNGDLVVDPTIRPVMDMSNVLAANSQMSGMFNATGSVSGEMSQSIARGYRNYGNDSASTPQSAEAPDNSTSVIINVYGAEGQDVDALADAVASKIGNTIVRRGVAFG